MVLLLLSCADGSIPTEINSDGIATATPPQNTPCKSFKKRVEFEYVSFEYDPCVFGNVNAENIADSPLEQPDHKPDGVAPEHLNFNFEIGPKYWEPILEIYPVQRFPAMYAVSTELRKDIENEITDLKRVIDEPSYRVNGRIPYLPYVDASQSFQTNVKPVHFKNGKGIFFVTYWSTEAALVSNDHLRYVFEGLTNDGKYIIAEIPIQATFLPDESPDEFEGYKREFLFQDYPHPNQIRRRYKDYISSITKRLETMTPGQFKPDLRELEQIIASLQVTD
jgi:hypothetical protein